MDLRARAQRPGVFGATAFRLANAKGVRQHVIDFCNLFVPLVESEMLEVQSGTKFRRLLEVL